MIINHRDTRKEKKLKFKKIEVAKTVIFLSTRIEGERRIEASRRQSYFQSYVGK